jgi:hypothetical protein
MSPYLKRFAKQTGNSFVMVAKSSFSTLVRFFFRFARQRYWKQINDTRDIYGQEVRIVHSSEYRQVCNNFGDI